MKTFVAGILASGIWICAWAAPEIPLALDADNINYSVGFRVGTDFKGKREVLNVELLLRGIQDAASGAQPLMSTEEMQATLTELQRRLVTEDRVKLQGLGTDSGSPQVGSETGAEAR